MTRKKNVRVSVCGFNKGRVGHTRSRETPDPERVHEAMRMATRAKREGADLALFPEGCCLIDCQDSYQFAEPLDGATFSAVAETARREEMFIAFNHPTLIDDQRHNTTILFNRAGEVEGLYHKMYPTRGELAEKIVPGEGAIVLDTEIGRLGFAICYDLNFSDLRDGYRQLQPDIILFSSYFPGGLLTRQWALETSAFFVSAIVDPGSCILNPLGRIQNELRGLTFQMTQTLNLESNVYHLDRNNLKLNTLREVYGAEVEIEFSDDEGTFWLRAIGDTPLATIEKEIGLENLHIALTRARQYRQDSCQGNFPPPGPPGW